jgi:hypothetical protein
MEGGCSMVSAVFCAAMLKSTHLRRTSSKLASLEINDHENSSVILNNFLASSPTHIDAFKRNAHSKNKPKQSELPFPMFRSTVQMQQGTT